MNRRSPDARKPPGGGRNARPTQLPQPGEGRWGGFRRTHVRAARLITFGPLALVVGILVLALGLPWWTLLLTLGGLVLVLAFLS